MLTSWNEDTIEIRGHIVMKLNDCGSSLLYSGLFLRILKLNVPMYCMTKVNVLIYGSYIFVSTTYPFPFIPTESAESFGFYTDSFSFDLAFQG